MQKIIKLSDLLYCVESTLTLPIQFQSLDEIQKPRNQPIGKRTFDLAENAMKTPNFKFVVVGDGAVGKTCLSYVFSTGKYPTDYIPTVVDNFTLKVNIDGRQATLNVWDTAGQEDFETIRLLSYPDADVGIMCFSLVQSSSLKNIVTRWAKELSENNKKAKIILVGTQSDILKDSRLIEELKSHGTTTPTDEEIKSVYEKIGALKYISTSAKENDGVTAVFHEAIRVCLKPEKENRTSVKGRHNSRGCCMFPCCSNIDDDIKV